ncbi:polycystin family receptor for egg jelly-like [Hemicordylus capensis]|uniref:polycystin family receptor for egg jelly-like n=1 Tax=Hemicordylus capensis TaxID=884348 RepID=UPI00230365D9|nr:polycystin family receptor for egg jelly-like [Hemicordylus capensis]
MQYLLCLIFLFCYWCCSQYRSTAPLHLLPPPLLVTCSNPKHSVYQRQDNEFQVSCLWDRHIEINYSRLPEANSEEEERDVQPPPDCSWFRDSILVNNTKSWSGQLVLGLGLPREGPHPPWVYSHITVQCISAFCAAPLCLHHNLSIVLSGQDVRFFLLWPRTLPIFEWQPVQLGWCARLKSSTWNYHFKSQGGIPADLLIPSNQHSELPPLSGYHNVELYQVCSSYYSYHLTVYFPQRGFYTASLTVEHGPPVSLSMDLFVEAALLHVFSGHSKLLSHPHVALSLSWSLLQLSQGIIAYELLDEQGVGEWSHSYSYNPFALQSDFCAVPTSRSSKAKVITSIYFCTNKRMSGELTGKLAFSNSTLSFTTNSAIPTHLKLNPQKTKGGTYVFSPTLGLYYSIHEGSAVNATEESSSSHYVFYQQQSLSYLIVVQFVQLQWYRFSVHVYLNRRGILFRTLGDKGLEVHHFNGHSPDESWVYIVWFIPVQHPLLQCEWSFSLELFDSKKEYLLWNNTYTYKDHVRNAAHFIPDSVLPFNPALYTGFVAKVKCASNGLLSIILKTTINIYASKVIKSRVTCRGKPCSITEVSIQRPDHSKHILHFAHGAEFSLAADSWINCPGPKQTDVIWNIYKVPDMMTSPDWSKPLNISGIRRRNSTILEVPSSSLEYGLYLFNFTVKLTSMNTWDSVEVSDSAFVEIGSDTLLAVIAGGNFRKVGFSDQWTLDGTGSSKAGAVQPSKEFRFTWYCTKQKTDYVLMTLSKEGKCYPNQVDLKWTTSSDPVQAVQPETLQENAVYYFRLVVQKDSQTAQAEQTVEVQPGSVPVLNVTCIENCGRSVIPNERFCLFGKCLNCRTSKPLYSWSLLSTHSTEIGFDWSSKSTTGRSNPYLRINAFAFVSMSEQSYVLSLAVVTKEGKSAVYKYSFHVHDPPRIGQCVLNPRIGMAFLTKFIIQCSGFEGKNGPLTYKVIAASDQMKISTISSIENSTLGIIVYVGHEHKTPQSFLPVGLPSHNSALIIYVQVYDALGACSQVTLKATVHDQRKSKPTDVVHQELQGLISGSSAPMTTLLVSKDYFDTGYFVYMLASLLNNIETSPTKQGSKTDLRQILLNTTARIPTTDVQKINQIILSICQVTHEITEVNKESQLLAVRKLKEVSEALKRHQNTDLGSKEIEILGNGILTGLSNVLRASLLSHGNVNVNAIKETISVTETLADLILQGKVPGEHETNMKAEEWTIYLWKDENSEVSGSFSNRKPCKNCFYPKLKQGHHAELPVDAVVCTVLYEFDKNPFPWLLYTADIGTTVTGFKMTGTKSNGDIIQIVPDVVEMIMARKDEDSATFDLTLGPDIKLPKTTGGFSVEVKRSSKDIFIQIVPKINVTFQVFIYLGLNISHPPVAVYTASHYSPPTPSEKDFNVTDCAIKAPYILCLPQSLLWSQVNSSRADKLNISVVLQSHPIVRDQTIKIVRIAVFTADCLVLDGVQNQWEEETCSLGPQTSWSKIHCICKAKERSKRTASSTGTSKPSIRFMASKVLVFPNSVDMKKFLLEQAGKNPVTGLTVLAIFIIYMFLAIWAIIQDNFGIRDQIIVLPDNDPFHKMKYLVSIYTGTRFRAGTTADVYIELIGQNGVSDVHQLKHPHFPGILQRGSVDTFILTTEEDLGDILSLHIWHNNFNFSSSWYLSRVKVQNMVTKQSWLFMCRKWLAIGKNDCRTERTFAVTDSTVPLNKVDCFMITVSSDLLSNHLWLSVFAHVISGSFNRFQRLSCCLTILLSSLMFNMIFFSTEKDQHIHSVELRYWRSMITGMISALISIPVQLIVVTLFKHSPKESAQSNTAQVQPKENFSLFSDSLSKEGDTGDASPSKVKSQQLPPTTKSGNKYAIEKETFHKNIQKLQLCWWCTYIAWVLAFLISLFSSVFIILYGLSYSYKTSFEWLIASTMSFCQHTFLLQPLMILIFSAYSTFSSTYCGSIPWSNFQDNIFNDRTMTVNEMNQLHNELVKVRASKQYQPIDYEVIILKKKRKFKIQTSLFIRDVVSHFVLTLVSKMSSFTEISGSFSYKKIIHETFIFYLSNEDMPEDIFTWMRNAFLALIHDYQAIYF